MKHQYFPILLAIVALFAGCETLATETTRPVETCTTDVAVTELEHKDGTPIGVNEPLTVSCVLKNNAPASSNQGCTSGENEVRIVCAYSPIFHSDFEDYQVYDDVTVPAGSLDPGEETIDEEMSMGTPPVPGYYAMKVEVMNDNDVDSRNNSRAIALRVD